MDFQQLCDLLPEGVTWGDTLTVNTVRSIVNAAQKQSDRGELCDEEFHVMLETIIDACDRQAIPTVWLSIINSVGIKFIKDRSK